MFKSSPSAGWAIIWSWNAMIKKLRAKFIAVIMVIAVAMLLGIFAFVCHNSYVQMERTSLIALKAAAQAPMPLSGPDGKGPHLSKPCFVLRMDMSGQLVAKGSDHYDLTDEKMLLDIYQQAKNSQEDDGILYPYDLRFCRIHAGPGEGYAFMDISTELATMRMLVINCHLIGLAALTAFFVVAFFLARWLVKPVEEAWEAQRQFVGDASHELKTPLTVILTNAELLQSPEYDEAAKERFASAIYAMSCQMRGLVESLLQLARVDNGKISHSLEAIDLSALAEECVLPFEALYFETGHTLDSNIEPGLQVMGSGQQLRQVIDILLDNGRKYAVANSTVKLKLTAQGHGHCLLSVASQGQPLTNQQCKDIFKRFYRVDTARSRNGSYGLGLAIAQEIVSRHRGRIWCQSKEGINTFSVWLPAKNSLHSR